MSKVLFYFFRLNNSSGGAERMLIRLASDLDAKGHKVNLVSWDTTEAKTFYPMASTITWHKLGFSPGYKDKFRRTIALVKLLRKIRPDVFIGFVMGADKTVYAANYLAGVPIIAAERNSPRMYEMKLGRYLKHFNFVLFLFARKIVVQFEEYKKGYPRYLSGRIVSIPNPVDKATKRAKPDIKGSHGWTLLSVARLEFQKNIPSLIKAFSLLANDFPEWNLRIAGDGVLRSEIDNLVSSLQLQGRVVMLGGVANVESEYESAHLFCLPSLWEGFPNALAEALAHGLPSIGFASCAGVNELIKNGINGLLADSDSEPKLLSESLRALMSNSELRREMGEKAARLSDCFAPSRLVEKWEEVIERASCDG